MYRCISIHLSPPRAPVLLVPSPVPVMLTFRLQYMGNNWLTYHCPQPLHHIHTLSYLASVPTNWLRLIDAMSEWPTRPSSWRIIYNCQQWTTVIGKFTRVRMVSIVSDNISILLLIDIVSKSGSGLFTLYFFLVKGKFQKGLFDSLIYNWNFMRN